MKSIKERYVAPRKGWETIESRLSAAATRIIFDMAPEGLSGIEIDGQPLTAEQQSVQAVEPTMIAIPNRGRITIEPAIKDRDKLASPSRGRPRPSSKRHCKQAASKTLNDAEDQYTKSPEASCKKADIARQEADLHAPAADDRDAGAQALVRLISKDCSRS